MPRIFVAIRFNSELKGKLACLQDALKCRGIQGEYCPYGNLHLTLAFIGERCNLNAVMGAIGEVCFKPFVLALDSLGTFPTKHGVIWCGVKQRDIISEIALQVRERLMAHGVYLRAAEFFPHISLVQRPSRIVADIPVPEASMLIDNIFVMKSERIDGVLVYNPIQEFHALGGGGIRQRRQ